MPSNKIILIGKKMQPYNICENRWLSTSRKKLNAHWKEYHPVYAVLTGIMAIALMVLAVVTAIASFLP